MLWAVYESVYKVHPGVEVEMRKLSQESKRRWRSSSCQSLLHSVGRTGVQSGERQGSGPRWYDSPLALPLDSAFQRSPHLSCSFPLLTPALLRRAPHQHHHAHSLHPVHRLSNAGRGKKALQ